VIFCAAVDWVGAHALLADRRATLATALDCGFASGEVFARAFANTSG
jgi:hypothetical protein